MRLLYLHILFFLFCISPAAAQSVKEDSLKNYKLDEVVITAGKFTTAKKNTPTRIEILDYKNADLSGSTRLPDILKSSSSVYIKSYGLTPFLQTISMNGAGPEHTLILIDGVKLNSFQNGQIDLSLIPGDNIQRIEIMNNGGSSLYGSEAISGMINIITGNRSRSGNDAGIEASALYGSFNTHRYSAAVSQQSHDFNTRIFYSIEKSDGDFDYNFTSGNETIKKQRKNAAYNIYDIGLSGSYFIDTANFLKYVSAFSFQDKQVPGIETGSSSSHTMQKDRNWNNTLISENLLSPSLSLYSTLNFQNNYMHYTTSETQKSYYKNLVYAVSSDLKWNKDSFNIIAGYSFTHASLNSNETKNGVQRNQHALYLSSELPVLQRLKLFPSARYDFISDIKKNVVSYKAGMNYQPFDNMDFALKANAGRNFRSPTFNDLYWKEWGNPDIKPEYSFNSEAGIFYSFCSFIETTAEISFNYIEAKDKIVWMPQRNLTWKPFNIDKSVSKSASFTLTLRKEFTGSFTLNINGGYVITESKKKSETYKGDPTYNKYVPYLPLNSARLNFTAEYNFISLSLLYTYTGKRYSDFENKNTADVFNLIDGALSFSFRLYELNAKIKLAINNLSNTDYETISGYPMPLRYYNLTLSFNY
jgi:iron complex outermembrane receptor protein